MEEDLFVNSSKLSGSKFNLTENKIEINDFIISSLQLEYLKVLFKNLTDFNDMSTS